MNTNLFTPSRFSARYHEKNADRLSVVGGRELKCQEGGLAYLGMIFFDKLSKVFKLVGKVIKRVRHTGMTMERR
jgi:hypothetical protein